MAIVKKKNPSQAGYDPEENAKEQYEMDIDGLNVPSPDEYPGPAVQDQINQGNNNQPNNIYGEIPLNEQALEELIEKEEESLTKKENSQMKGLEEIKKEKEITKEGEAPKIEVNESKSQEENESNGVKKNEIKILEEKGEEKTTVGQEEQTSQNTKEFKSNEIEKTEEKQ